MKFSAISSNFREIKSRETLSGEKREEGGYGGMRATAKKRRSRGAKNITFDLLPLLHRGLWPDKHDEVRDLARVPQQPHQRVRPYD